MDQPTRAARAAPSIARRVARETLSDRMMLVAGGLAFFATFALMPALAAIGLAIGLLVSEETLRRELSALDRVVPEDTIELAIEFLTEVPAGLGFGATLLVNLAIVFWTMQRSASGLITTLNMVYEREERRGRLRRECVAIAIAGGVVGFLFLALLLVVAAPLALREADGAWATLAYWGRWPLLGLLFLGGLTLLYRHAPCHGREGGWRVLGAGPLVATAIFLVASAILALYLRYGEGWDHFYGTATSVVVLMTWVFVSALCIMIGAETNAQLVARLEGREDRAVERFRRHQSRR